MITMKNLFTEKFNRSIFILIIPVVMLLNQINNQYVTGIFFTFLLLIVFLKFRYMYLQDKENGTKTVQKALPYILLITVLFVIYRLAINYFFYSEPL